jgi:hypothetical protein
VVRRRITISVFPQCEVTLLMWWTAPAPDNELR